MDIHNERCFSLNGAADQPWPWAGERTLFYASGREALLALIDALQLPTGSAVLLPALVPEGLIAPCRLREMSVELYALDENLDPDWDDLQRLLSEKAPRLAVMIHFFGLTKPIARFVELCHRHNVFVVEDLAHVLQAGDGALGASGDAVLYSLPKVLGVPDGAPLVIRAPTVELSRFASSQSAKHFLYVLQHAVTIGANTLTRKFPAERYSRKLRQVIGGMCPTYATLMAYYHEPNRMSPLSRWLLKRIDLQGQIKIRQHYAQIYHERLHLHFRRFAGADFQRHSTIGFPVRVPQRDAFALHLYQRGMQGIYFVGKWDFISEKARPSHQSTIDVMHDHFLFPTSPHLAESEIEAVVSAANEWAEQARA